MPALILAALSWPRTALAAGSWSYGITDIDTPGVIDGASTSAYVDTLNRQIRLPYMPVPNVVSFLPGGGFDYAVLTGTGVKEFVFDGSKMVENTVTSVSGLTNPTALATPEPYPDVVVADSAGVRHYSFTGTGMAENPALGVAGLTGVVSVGATRDALAALTGGRVKAYASTGSGMVEVPALEPDVPLNNPIALALTGGYDLAVLEPDRVRFFNFDGTRMAENPALAVTGLANPVALAADGKEIAVVEGAQVKHYSFDGSRMTYNAALSVTSGLTSPSAVAIRSGYYDRIIVDGQQVRYFSFDGTKLVENPALSVTVADILQGNNYRPSAAAVSLPRDPGVNATHVRVRANFNLPEGTSVIWSVTADGVNWTKRWRVTGLASGTLAEVSDDNGLTWRPIGDAGQVSPAVDNPELWAAVTPGRQVRWMAELSTTDTSKTPLIIAPIVWEADGKPSVVLDPVPGWFYTTTPTFTWSFSDPDPGDAQSAFQLVVRREADGAVVYDSGKVISSDTSFTLPTSYAPDTAGPLWLSGTYKFTVEVRVWDSAGVASDWTTPEHFRVLAFERPRIKEIVSPPPGQVAPDPNNPATWIMITPGMTAGQLPKAKAGAKVTLVVDSVGPINTPPADVAVFPYGSGRTATVGDASAQNALGSPVNRWEFSFWTDASLSNTPDGTVVEMRLTGTGTEGGTTTFNAPPYAAGVVMTEGSIYEDWFVVLQGSKR